MSGSVRDSVALFDSQNFVLARRKLVKSQHKPKISRQKLVFVFIYSQISEHISEKYLYSEGSWGYPYLTSWDLRIALVRTGSFGTLTGFFVVPKLVIYVKLHWKNKPLLISHKPLNWFCMNMTWFGTENVTAILKNPKIICKILRCKQMYSMLNYFLNKINCHKRIRVLFEWWRELGRKSSPKLQPEW